MLALGLDREDGGCAAQDVIDVAAAPGGVAQRQPVAIAHAVDDRADLLLALRARPHRPMIGIT